MVCRMISGFRVHTCNIKGSWGTVSSQGVRSYSMKKLFRVFGPIAEKTHLLLIQRVTEEISEDRGAPLRVYESDMISLFQYTLECMLRCLWEYEIHVLRTICHLADICSHFPWRYPYKWAGVLWPLFSQRLRNLTVARFAWLLKAAHWLQSYRCQNILFWGLGSKFFLVTSLVCKAISQLVPKCKKCFITPNIFVTVTKNLAPDLSSFSAKKSRIPKERGGHITPATGWPKQKCSQRKEHSLWPFI